MKSDSDLLVLYRESGDRDALDVLVRRHYPAVCRTVARLVPDDADARDLAQATFLRALRSTSTVRSPERFRAWILRVAVNEVRQWWRRGKLETVPAVDDWPAHAAESEPVPKQAGMREFERALDRSLTRLPRELREPIVLRYYEEMSLAEIAATLDLPKSTVQSRCDRGIEQLRRGFRKLACVALLPRLDELRLGGGARRGGIPLPGPRAAWLGGTAVVVLLVAVLVVPGLTGGGGSDSPTRPGEPGDPRVASGPGGETGVPPAAKGPGGAGTDGETGGGPGTGDAARTSVIATEGDRVLAGRVLELGTNEPVDGVRIEVRPTYGSDSDWIGRDDLRSYTNVYYSDSTGAFSLTGLPEDGVFDLHLTRTGYAYASRGDVRVGMAGRARDVGVIFLGPGRSLAGTVVDEGGRLVAGARVDAGDHRATIGFVAPRLSRNGLYGASATTDAEGRFELTGLAPGGHRIEVRASGFATAALHPVGVPAEGDVPPLRVVLDRDRIRAGRVVDPAGDGVAGATVTVTLHESRHVATQGYSFSQYWGRYRTDGEGRFEIAGLPSIHFRLTVEVEHPDYHPPRAAESDGSGALEEIVLLPREPEDGFPVGGVVVDLNGRPPGAGPARVTLERDDLVIEAEAAVGTGAFRFPAVPVGEWELSTEVRGLLPAFRTVAVAGPVEGLRIEHERGGAVGGRVTDAETGEPIAGALVDPAYGFPVTTGPDGGYEIGGLPPGRNLIGAWTVSAEGYFPASPALRSPEAGRKAAQDVALRPTSTGVVFRGRVVSADGRPVLGASVGFRLSRAGEAVRWIFTASGEDGTFAFEPLDGTGLRWPAPISARHPLHASAAAVAPGAEDAAAGIDIVLRPGRTVTGAVRTAAGDPVPGATVVAGVGSSSPGFLETEDPDGTDWRIASAPSVGSAITDADGSFRLEHVPSGPLRLVALKAGYRWSGASGRIGTTVPAGADVADVVVLVRPGREIRGRVRTPDGDPVDGAGIRGWPGLLYTKTDEDGLFRLTGVFAEKIRLSIPSPHYQCEVDAVAGNDRVVDLVALPCGTVAGRAVDARGEPRAGVVVGLRPASGGPRRATTGEDGGFRFAKVPVGEAEIAFPEVPGSEPRKVTVLFQAEAPLGDLVVR